MKRTTQWMLAAILIISGASFQSCKSNSTAQSQLLEIYDVQGSAAKARLTVDGKVLFTTDVFIGKNGIGKTGEGDSKTPTGTLRPLSAFGIKPNPGTKMPYINITPSHFACDEDCQYYNQIIDTAAVHHPCKGEEMYSYQPHYNYGIATDFNKECVYPKGSAIFVHVKGPKPYTGGCIAFDEDKMIEILKNCDMSLVITVKEPEPSTQQEIKTKIIGKWKKTVTDGVEVLTNQRAIRTYQTDGKVFFSQSARKTYGWVWENHLEGTYAVEGNTLYENIPGVSFKSQINSINDKVIDKLVQTRTNTETGDILNLNQPHKYVKVNVDYSRDIIGLWEGVEMTGYETYGNAEARIEYKADGTYTYYRKVNGEWEEFLQDVEEWNVDGDWLATRWSTEDSEEVNYEWWDIESVNGETMKWSAIREKEDGSRFNTTFTWKKIK